MLRWANNDFSDGEKLLEVTDCTPLCTVLYYSSANPFLFYLHSEQVIRQFKPTVLLGLSTKGGLFNEEVIRTMHQYW